MSRVHCPKCGHDNEAASKFCGSCAAPLGQSTAGPTPGPGQLTVAKTDAANKRKGIIIIGAFGALVPAVMIAFMGGGGGCNGSAEGQIVSTGAPHGDYTLTPTACYSGQHEDFFGVWVAPELSDEGGHTGWKGGLKLVKSHTNEWEVYVESPTECQSFDCEVRPLDPAGCTKFEVDVHDTGNVMNDIRVREGHVNLECETPEGGTFVASLTFEGCS